MVKNKFYSRFTRFHSRNEFFIITLMHFRQINVNESKIMLIKPKKRRAASLKYCYFIFVPFVEVMGFDATKNTQAFTKKNKNNKGAAENQVKHID